MGGFGVWGPDVQVTLYMFAVHRQWAWSTSLGHWFVNVLLDEIHHKTAQYSTQQAGNEQTHLDANYKQLISGATNKSVHVHTNVNSAPENCKAEGCCQAVLDAHDAFVHDDGDAERSCDELSMPAHNADHAIRVKK